MWSSIRRIMRRFTVRLLSGWNISLEELQSGLKEGIALCSDEELYEFLENYSS